MSILNYVLALIVALSLNALFTSTVSASAVSASTVSDPTDVDADVAVITGQVTSEVYGSPISGINVFLIDLNDQEVEILSARTDTSGLYTITQLISNTWILKFIEEPILYEPKRYATEYYNNAYIIENATPITADLGTITPNINVALASRGQISGRVTAEDNGSPIENVKVDGFRPDESFPSITTYTDNTGAYNLETRATGEYKLLFSPPIDTEYAIEYYDNAQSRAEATIITVQEDLPIYDIDIELSRGGSITGVVNSSWLGKLIQYPSIFVYNDAGEMILSNWNNPYGRPGQYIVSNLPSGQYTIKAYANRHIETQYPVSVTVVASEVTPNINMQLQKYVMVNSIATSSSTPGIIGLTFQNELIPFLAQNGGNSWQVVPFSTWAIDPVRYEFADLFDEFDVNIAVTSRGTQSEGTRLIVAAGSRYQYGQIASGLYRSGDYGQTWATSPIQATAAVQPCDNIGTNKLIASPIKPNTLYLVNQCNDSSPFLLHVSHDGGVTWDNVSTVGGRVLRLSENLVPSPVVENRLYATDELGKWLQSDDAGQNWIEKDFDLDVLALDAKNENYLYGLSTVQNGPDGNSTRIGKRSRDGGNTWQEWAPQPCPYASPLPPPFLMAHPTESNIIFLLCNNGLTDGLYRSDNGGDGWVKLSDINGQMLAPDYGTPGRILWARVDGLFASTDAGVTWQALLPEYRLLNWPLYLPTISTKPN